MRAIAGIRRVVHLCFGVRGIERAADDELRFHLEMRAEELMRTGATREAADAQAQAEFGDIAEARRELVAIDRRRHAHVARIEWWQSVLQDARVALRGYSRQPGFTIVVLSTLALGIGATTAMFSIVNAVLLRPLPYARPDRLVHLWETPPNEATRRDRTSYPAFLDWRRERALFSALEAYDETNVTVSDASGAAFVRGARVTSGFFAMLGVATLRGRAFSSEDDLSTGTRAVVLSHGLWTRRFGADRDVIGRTLTIDGTAHDIIGVLPAQFRFAPVGEAEIWLPIGRIDEVRARRFNRWLNVVGRLRDEVSIDLARRRMDDVMRLLALQYPETNSGRGIVVTPLQDEVTADVARPLVVLFVAVAIVLLIACANVASLVLARSIERGHEMAVRTAIGASRARIVRQLLTENVVLALAGAVLGAWLAAQGVRLLVAALAASIFDRMPALRDASVDLTALAFTITVAVGTGILFGLVPARLVSRDSAGQLLRSDSRAGRSRYQMRGTIVTTEIALTLVLLVSATLMGRSLIALLRVDPGFTAERVATMRVALAGPSYQDGEVQQRFFEELLARIRALPNVEASGAISNAPLQGGGRNTFHVDGAPEPPPAARPEAATRAVAGDYFSALGIPVLQGRVLNARDDSRAPYAVVISESLARRLFGTRAAVGERLRFYTRDDSAWTIVGVVGDVKTDALDEPAVPTIYYSHLQGPANRMSIVSRAREADPAALLPALRREVNAMDATLPVYSASTMVQYIARSPAVYQRRYMLILLGGFATAALLLAIIGVYGVIANAVTQRTREIAIRISLGANNAQVLALVLRDGLRLVGVGVAVGAVAAFAASRTLVSLLFGVSPADPWTYVLVALLLVLVALVASYLPARRATKSNPALALRTE